MTYQNLKVYCETQYRKAINMNKKKQECPKCGHKTFCLYGDNLEKAKCFHPSCGLYLNLNMINHGVDYRIIVSDRFFEHSKKYLFKEINGEYIQAFVYAHETRNIPELILKCSDVGACDVLYDVLKENEDLIQELKDKIENTADAEKKGKLQIKLKELEEFIQKLKQFINDNKARLLFFYRDENGLITQIKSRRPYIDTKTFQILKVQDKAGVFNSQIFSIDEFGKNKSFKKLNSGLIIVEGEFDQLSLVSCFKNMNINIEVCAIGGANGDIDTALKLQAKSFCILYDNDEAGKNVLNKAKEKSGVFGLTTPEGIKDIDEFINSYKDKKQCYEAICNLFKGIKYYNREFRGIKAEIISLMKNSNYVNLDKCQLVSLTIIKELLKRGKFFKDNNYSYIFLNDDKKIIPIISTDEQLKRLLNRMGVNAAKDYYGYVVNEVSTYAYDNGVPIETHNFCHYERKSNALFISNNDKTVYKITTKDIEELENGDEGIMFNYKPDYEPFEFVKIDNSTNYFEKFVSSSMNVDTETGILFEYEYKTLLFIWFLATFFHSIMPSKVLLVTVVEKGSRKTSILKRMGIILFGSKYNVTPLPNKPEDFDTLVTNNHLVILDNVDTGKSWLNDKLASTATGQTIEKRKLYTDNESVKLPAKNYLALTSRTPQFTRDDVADRLICIPLVRKDDYIAEDIVMKEVITNRNEIMSFIILELQKVLKAIETTKENEYKTKFRIADFAVFGLRIFDSLGKKEEFESILNKVCEVQKDFAVEEDSLVYILKIFAKQQFNPHKISGFELHQALLGIANEDNFNIPEFKTKYKSVKSLTRRIANIKGNISNDVKITIYKERANHKSYKIELVDKDFELPPTNDSIFANGMEKAQNMINTSLDNKGVNNE